MPVIETWTPYIAKPALNALASVIRWWLMRPRIEFGSPVQKGRDFTQSWWHIPVTIHPGWGGTRELPHCRIYLIDHPGTERGSMIQMCLGDMIFTAKPVAEKTLGAGSVVLVPIAIRDEVGNDAAAYITDAEFFSMEKHKYPIFGGDRRRRFKLLLQSGDMEVISTHFYLICVPPHRQNGHFSVEIQYQGKGLAPISILPSNN